jgi:SAM-dependent methyltransferase
MLGVVALFLHVVSTCAIQVQRFHQGNTTNSSHAKLLDHVRIESIHPSNKDWDDWAWPKRNDKFFKILKDVYGSQYYTSRSAAHGLSQQDKEDWAKVPANHGDKNWPAATYGEVTPEGMRLLLQSPNISAMPNEKFYDLGSGDGKAVMVAWLMGLQATGIELVDKRFDESCRALGEVEKLQRPRTASSVMRFYKGSFTDLSFDDADIVFMNNVCWQEDLLKQITTAAKELKKGSRIIASKPLEAKDFVTLGTIRAPISWGDKPHTYTIQWKASDIAIPVKPSRSLSGLPAKDHCEL